jgi:hypothetical protein
MNRGRISTQVMLCFLAMMLFVTIGCGGGGGGSAPSTYSITGAVSGYAPTGVTINLTGAATATATTDASGNFSFTGLSNGTYIVTPVKTGNKFNPVSLRVVVSGANGTNTNFVATANSDPTHSLSGKVSGVVQAHVIITISGGATGTTETDASGNYSFSGLVNGNYTVTPSLTGYDFAPSHRDVTVNNDNPTVDIFTSTVTPEPTYSISGKVSGGIAEGVTIQLTGKATTSTTTLADGTYTISGLYNGNYTVTPYMDGYTFNPTSTAVAVNGADQSGKDFVATKIPVRYTISGTVSGDILEGVTMTLSGAGSGTTTTNASGNYSFSSFNGIYTVTPSMSGYTFSPTSAAVTVSDANATVDNFVATAKPSVTWKEFVLMTSSSSTASWRRRTLKFDSSTGILFAASSCLNSSGSTTCPNAGSLTWTNSAGVITESGTSADTNVHMTMTSTGNFIAGTGNSSSSQLRVIQKVVPGKGYTSADIELKQFVFHEMIVGSSTKWRYGSGGTDASGAITLASQTEPTGPTTPDTTWGTLSVNTSGVVTMSGASMSTFQGFLSDDKKTIVGTYTNGTTYRLMILQITGKTYSAGSLPESTWKSSILAKSTSSYAGAGWVYCTNTVDASGDMTFGSDWNSDNDNFKSRRPTTSFTGSISSSGTVTMAGSNYHGQASDDWNFLVGTMTLEVSVPIFGTIPVYFLQVGTR